MVHELQLAKMTTSEAREWMEMARLESIVGSCRRSLKSVTSGLNCYFAFVRSVCGSVDRFFPPRLEWLQCWSMLFRNPKTFSNYLGYVKIGCLMAKADASVFAHPAIVQAKNSVAKEGGFQQRAKMWIRRKRVEEMMRWARSHSEWRDHTLLFLMTYVFLLRMPSEALPMVVAGGDWQAVAKSVVTMDWSKGQLVLQLSRRKNKASGSRLVRTCWCSECPHTCPVHVLGKFVSAKAPGSALFAGITATSALVELRRLLAIMGVDEAVLYRTHDLRRGHALDLQCSGAPLYQILEAGEWSSPAFLKYLDMNRLDTELVVQAHLDESDDSDACD